MNDNEHSVSGYIDLLKEYERVCKSKIKNNGLSKLDRILFWLLAGLIIMSFFFIGVYWFFKPDYVIFANVSITLIVIAYVVLLLMPFLKIYEGRESIRQFFSMPLSASVEQNIREESLVDEEFLPRFIFLGKNVLELGLVGVKHERDFLNKRISLMIGAVDKLGILPGVISMMVVVSKPIVGHDWIMGLAYGYIALLVLSVFFVNTLVKYDRIVLLTELALSRCENDEIE